MLKRQLPLFLLVIMTVLCDSATADPILIGWWPFDEGSDITVFDSVGGNNGTINGATWQDDLLRGWCLYFDDCYVELPAAAFSGLSDNVTVSLWQYADPVKPRGRFFQGSQGETNKICGFFEDGDMYWQVGQDNGIIEPVSSSEYSGQWHHWVLTLSGTSIKIYHNGIEWQSASNGQSIAGIDIFYVGSRSDDEWNNSIDRYKGLISDFRVYDRALSETEIQELLGSAWQIAWNPNPANEATDVNNYIDFISWSPGCEASSHDVYFGRDFNDVNDGIGDTFKGNQDTNSFAPGVLSSETTYYWRIDEVNDTNVWKGDVWSFTSAVNPFIASSRYPDDGAAGMGLNINLNWLPGENVADMNGHDIYFGTDYNNVKNANIDSDEYMGSQDANAASFELLELEYEQTYYWRIDEVNDTNVWKGDVWSFSTGASLDKILTWPIPEQLRVYYDFYIGCCDYNDVYEANSVDYEYVGRQTRDNNSYDPNLTDGITYYWRVDILVAGQPLIIGDVQSFKTVPLQCSMDITEGDFNGDCVIDLFDYAIVADCWLQDCDWDELKAIINNWLSCAWNPLLYCP